MNNNGMKKRYFVIPAVLILAIVGGSVGYGELKNKVTTQASQIERMADLPQQMARIEENVENLEKNLDEFKEDTKEDLGDIKSSINKVLEALLR